MLDVTSLYTNIPNKEGTRALAKALLMAQTCYQVPGIQTLKLLLKMVLTMNNFAIQWCHYLQVGSTAMRTQLAPSYVNLFMSVFEDKFVYTCKD